MERFLGAHGVLNKEYKDWVTDQSKKIVEHADKYSRDVFGCNARYIASLNIRKETLAHEQKKKLGIETGLIGIWSCVESCDSFKSAI